VLRKAAVVSLSCKQNHALFHLPSPLALLKNLSIWHQNIPFHEVAKTIQDAILVTLRLGFRYLWVDSLCIIQDSIADWQEHSVCMANIYKNCIVCIAASSAKGASEGFFGQRDPSSIVPVTVSVKLDQLEKDNYFIYNSILWSTEISSSPLNSRGWVLQERILSPRTLHFTSTQLFWECRTKCASEAYPKGHIWQVFALDYTLSTSIKRDMLPKLPITHLDSSAYGGDHNVKILEGWRVIVAIYSTCKLSHPSDKLVALSGLASYFKDLLRDDYLAG
jgi:hypothetical protein